MLGGEASARACRRPEAYDSKERNIKLKLREDFDDFGMQMSKTMSYAKCICGKTLTTSSSFSSPRKGGTSFLGGKRMDRIRILIWKACHKPVSSRQNEHSNVAVRCFTIRRDARVFLKETHGSNPFVSLEGMSQTGFLSVK